MNSRASCCARSRGWSCSRSRPNRRSAADRPGSTTSSEPEAAAELGQRKARHLLATGAEADRGRQSGLHGTARPAPARARSLASPSSTRSSCWLGRSTAIHAVVKRTGHNRSQLRCIDRVQLCRCPYCCADSRSAAPRPRRCWPARWPSRPRRRPRRQIAIIQDTTFLNSPVTALPQARALGARTIRAFVSWYLIAPHPASIHRPRFNASDPNGYPAADWAPYDQMVRLAARERVRLDLELTGGAPRWAEGRNAPRQYRANRSSGWWPSAKLYGQFVHAVTERYDGHFTPPGSPSHCPRSTSGRFGTNPTSGSRSGRSRCKDRPSRCRRGSTARCWTPAGAPCAAPAEGPQHRANRGDRRHRVRVAHARRPGQAAGRRLEPARAGVRARAVLRRRPLQGAAGRNRRPLRVPAEPDRLAEVPRSQPGAVRGDRLCRSPLRLEATTGRQPGPDQPRLRDVPRPAPGRPSARSRHRRLRALTSGTRSTTTSTATSPARPTRSRVRTRRNPRPRSTSTRPSTSATRTPGGVLCPVPA